MNNRLLVNPGTPQAWEITLKPGVNRIGRTEENDFTISHQSVSTHHCEITVTDQAVFLKDLGSANGTFVERVPVTEIQLYPGQHVQFGSVGMTFQSDIAPVLPEAINQPAAGARIISANPGPSAPAPPAPATAMRTNRPALATAPTTSTSPSVPGPSFSATAPGSRIQTTFITKSEPSEKTHLGRGIVGAVGGGLVGMFVWYFLIKLTSSSLSLVAWGVGVAAGFGGRFLAKQHSTTLGLACALCALIAIIVGQYRGVRAVVEEEGRKASSLAYFAQLESARLSLKAAEQPEELQKLVAENSGKTIEAITAEEIKTFQEQELPVLRDFVEGKPSKEKFTKERGAAFAAEFNYKEHFLKKNVKSGIFMVVFAVLGVWTAWKIGSGDDAQDHG